MGGAACEALGCAGCGPLHLFPPLQANKLDLRLKTKKGALQQPELVKFVRDVGQVSSAISALIGRMIPIYQQQKKAFIEEIARLQREAR
jgi:hypothetical protein